MKSRSAAFLVFATLMAGCGDDVSGPDIPSALEVVVADGVRYRAATQFSKNQPQHWLVVTITATNTGTDSVFIEFEKGSCPHLGFLVHDNPNRRGDPVWDNLGPTAVCQAGPVNFALPPGGSEELEMTQPIDEIMGAAGRSGRYYFTVLLRLAPGPVALKAGDLELTEEG